MEELVCETSGPRERIIGRIITRSKEISRRFGDVGLISKSSKRLRGAEARLRAPTFGEEYDASKRGNHAYKATA